MGIISSIAKIGVNAYKYGKRVLNCAPEFILGESAQIVGKGFKSASGSIFAKSKAGLKAFEHHVDLLSATKGGFLKRLFVNTKNLIPDLYKAGKVGLQTAKSAGKSGVFGALKGVGKSFSKKLPYIGAVLTIAFELPNIIEGYKKEGITGALKQAGGAGIELGCMAAGAAIGSCFGPGLGTLIGSAVGGLVGWGIRSLVCPEVSDEDENPQAENAATQVPAVDNSTQSETQGVSSDETSSQNTNVESSTPVTPSVNPSTVVSPSIPSIGPANPSGFGSGAGFVNSFGTGFGVNPSIGFGSGFNNPFGMGLEFTNPYLTSGNFFVQPGENIFQKYPMGYQFQYIR